MPLLEQQRSGDGYVFRVDLRLRPDGTLGEVAISEEGATAYYSERPDPQVASQRVAFGTSGHRGVSFQASFNEWHVLAMTQAICSYRKQQGITGPLFLGFDTHALSAPAFASSLEVLAANEVEVLIASGDEYTPTPALSHAILNYNRGRTSALADGIVITPSHNPPDSGGFKYNPPNGGPADTQITGWVQDEANRLLAANLEGVRRITLARARSAPTTHEHDYLHTYVNDLANVIDLDAIRGANIRMGVDPLGGAGVHYWAAIAEQYKLNLSVVNDTVVTSAGDLSAPAMELGRGQDGPCQAVPVETAVLRSRTKT